MANLSEEERKILEQAQEIQDRLEAERLEAGEIDSEFDDRRRKKREEQRVQGQKSAQLTEAERRRRQEISRRRHMEMRQRQQEMGRAAQPGTAQSGTAQGVRQGQTGYPSSVNAKAQEARRHEQPQYRPAGQAGKPLRGSGPSADGRPYHNMPYDTGARPGGSVSSSGGRPSGGGIPSNSGRPSGGGISSNSGRPSSGGIPSNSGKPSGGGISSSGGGLSSGGIASNSGKSYNDGRSSGGGIPSNGGKSYNGGKSPNDGVPSLADFPSGSSAAAEKNNRASREAGAKPMSQNQEYWEAAQREVAAARTVEKRAVRSRAQSRTLNGADRRHVSHPQRQASQRDAEGAATYRRRKKKNGFAKKLLTVLIAVAIIFAILSVGAYGIVRGIISKTNYQPYESDYVRAADVMHDPDVMNVLLIGSDEREGVDTARSDAMIVLSVNQNTKKIVMTSILRDSYVQIPGAGQQRINHAYQMGGPALLIQTIEENFKIGIDYYASVDFFSFIDIIDCVDGVDIEVTDEEVQWVNAYLAELNNILGDPEGDQYISGPGTMTMTGKQALAYSRIRYVGTDFARTERQRTVLNAVIEKLKGANPIQLFRVVNTVLPDVSTDMDDHAMTMTLFKAVLYLGYDIEQCRIPMDGTWWNEDANGQEVLGMDFAANIAGLKNTIYGE